MKPTALCDDAKPAPQKGLITRKEKAAPKCSPGEDICDFLATISHEIRTPMNSIIGMAELLTESELPHPQHDYSTWIFQSATHLLNIVNELLDFSKISSGKMGLTRTGFDLRNLCEEVVNGLTPEAVGKGVDLQLRCSYTVPTHVCGDPVRIRQILLNLIGNALKFTEKGHVSLTVECLHQTATEALLRINVADTGTGIDQDKLPLLFRKFSRIDPSPGNLRGGTGLGLAISKKLVQMMGGKIGVKSRPGEGSLFWFSLRLPLAPAVTGQTAVASDPAPAPGDYSGQRVLVVEDSPPCQIVVSAMLESIGCRADTAANGIEAVEMVKRNRYDIVLMDCCMPLMDGFAACDEIRRSEREKSPVIIALTANAMDGYREQCIAAGMDDYLSKPIRYHELQAMLARWSNCDRNTSMPREVSLNQAPPGQLDAEGLDTERLRNVSSAFRKTGKDFFPAVFEPFLKNVEESIPILRSAIEEHRVEAVRETLHRLQGGSSSLGIDTMSTLCAAMLQKGREETLQEVAELVQSLERALPGVREQVISMREAGFL